MVNYISEVPAIPPYLPILIDMVLRRTDMFQSFYVKREQ